MPSPVFTTRRGLVLASGSPRRKTMLEGLGLDFDIVPSLVEEPLPEMGEGPVAYALRAARTKGADVAERTPGRFTLAADTVVVAGELVLGKPNDPSEAKAMLSRLAGEWHEVVTACVLFAPLGPGGVERAKTREVVESSRVKFADVAPGAIDAYVACGEPADKAGAYAIQGLGGFLVERVEGSCSNVIGLPLAQVVEVLESWGVIVPR
jgi:septum formation protein